MKSFSSTTSRELSHFHPLQVENCGSNSRLVVDENDYGKFRIEKVNLANLMFKASIQSSYLLALYMPCSPGNSTLNSWPDHQWPPTQHITHSANNKRSSNADIMLCQRRRPLPNITPALSEHFECASSLVIANAHDLSTKHPIRIKIRDMWNNVLQGQNTVSN